jgi:hypothetical protein
MPNPLGEIIPLLELLGTEINILPAIGGAVEELSHPDQEEIEDATIDKGESIITEFAELPEPDPSNIYRSTPILSRKQKHLFRFFIDGSIRTYFLGTGTEANRSFPIELSQIGAAVVSREDDGQPKILLHRSKVLLLLPRQNQGISDTLWEELRKLPKPENFEIVDFTLPDPLSDVKSEPRDKAGAKGRAEMHRLEIDLIKATDDYRNNDSWLILDGSVRFIEQEIWDYWREKESPYVIGVAKSFRKDLYFQFSKRMSSRRKDITALLAGLPYAHRTAVFNSDSNRIGFWYVRIREQKEVDYPLMGVVKVEIPRPKMELIPSDLADLISSCLIAERNVTPYGLDRRWHCSLYPIYIAEQVIKNRFYSKEVLMGCIKWPRTKRGGNI